MLFARDLAAAIVTLAAALIAATGILLGGGVDRPHHATQALHGAAANRSDDLPAPAPLRHPAGFGVTA